jgi:adenylate cyclase
MGVEIERKFLVRNDLWRSQASQGAQIKQGYLMASEDWTLRVRMMPAQAFLTLKGATRGIRRREYEMEIPLEEAQDIYSDCICSIEKTRYRVHVGDAVWEVDEFSGENTGLVIAEIELPEEEASFEKPDWLGAEVSADIRYFNACLAQHPLSSWAK